MRDRLSAFVGGTIFGFSSYEIGQLFGHLNLDFTCVVPLLILLIILRFRGRISRFIFISLTGLGLTLQMGISTEIVATLCTLGSAVFAIFFWFEEIKNRKLLVGLAIDLIFSFILTIVLSSPILYYLAIGAATAPGAIQSIPTYSADPINFFFPTVATALGHVAAAPLIQRITGNPSEQGAYLGLPLILIVIAYARESWGERRARAITLSTCCLVLFSLGPVLHIDGINTGIPLPWVLVKSLPLIKSALPIRFTLYIALCVAIIVSAWITKARGRLRYVRFFLAGAGYLFLIPNTAAYAWAKMPIPLHGIIKPGANVIILPFAGSGPGMAWQLESHMRFTQSGGYVGFTPTTEWAWPVIKDFVNGKPKKNFFTELSAYCVIHHVEFLIVNSNTPAPLKQAILNLKWPVKRQSNILVVRVPNSVSARYLAIQGNYWPSSTEKLSWMGKKATIITVGSSARLTISGSRRPQGLPNVRVNVTINGVKHMYDVSRDKKFEIDLPKNSKTIIQAKHIFRPKDVIHNHDYRHLSVAINVKQNFVNKIY